MTAYFIPMDVQQMLMLRHARDELRNGIITKQTYRYVRAKVNEHFARARWWETAPVRTKPWRKSYTRKQTRKLLQKAGRV
jgi:hypothetical protein